MMKFYTSLAVLAGAMVANAQFVNGDFSAGTLAGWTLTNTANGVSWVNNVVSVDIDLGGPLGPSNAAQFAVGNRATPNQGQQGISITQSLALTGGVQYTFGFDWMVQNTNTATGSNSEGGQFNLIVNGASIGFGAAGSTANGTSRAGQVSGVFTPGSSGSHDVGAMITRQFTVPGGQPAPTLFQHVDNFTMNPPVPEPATMAVLGLGVAALLRRKRRS